MKFTVVYGSPRKKGNTAALLAPFMDELEKNGAKLDFFDVYEKNISGCRACLKCQQNKSKASCIIDDDMQPILESVSSSDFLVIAAPIYCWGIPGPVKTVLDRFIYAFCKYYGDDPHGPALLKGKKLALLTTCGYSVEKGTDLYEESMKRTAKHCKMEARARAFARTLI